MPINNAAGRVTCCGTATMGRLLLLLSFCVAMSSVHGYDYVPVTSIMYVDDATGVLATDSAMCSTRGTYLATEATAVLHEADIQAIESNTDPSWYYSFLGGGIVQPADMSPINEAFCPFNPNDPEMPQIKQYPADRGDPSRCYWRWYAGRWVQIPSDTGLPYDKQYEGIIFYRNNLALPSLIFNNFPVFFDFGNLDIARPGIYKGRHVTLFRNSLTTKGLWSDNYFNGGDLYASFIPDKPSKETTLKYWRLVCQSQGPLRIGVELMNTSSQLQERWWAIFFAILFVLCLVVALVVFFCQEREDMDEPPEDAPEWAEEETTRRTVSRRYMSQRSFRSDLETGSGNGSVLKSKGYYEIEQSQ